MQYNDKNITYKGGFSVKRRLVAGLLVCAVLLSVSLFALASSFIDTQGHWAASFIDDAAERGLFAGTDDTHFSPDTVMDRAMFVTVLGRVAGIDPADYDPSILPRLFTDTDPDAYYAPFVAWAVSVGVTEGVGNGLFAPNTQVTREQMARFIHTFLIVEGYLEAPQTPAEIPALPEDMARNAVVLSARRSQSVSDIDLPPDEFGDPDPAFSDFAQIASWAKDSVVLLKDSGLFSGAPDGKGGYAFLPKKTATRAEGAVVFCNLQDLMAKKEAVEQIEVNNLVLNQDSAEVEAGGHLTLSATVFPLDATNPRVIWYSTDSDVLTVDASGTVTGVAEGEATVFAHASNGMETSCNVRVTPPSVLSSPPEVYAPSSQYDKCMLIFGTPMNDPRLAYAGAEEAEQHMTTLAVSAWDIDTDGEKFTRTFYLTVHENVAPIVRCIFDEIYALPEQVPIHSLGGYRWDGKCEHSIGLAIDINPMENYYCTPDGTAVVGKYFKPGEDPYSIPVMGSVDQIFAKYGFKRGIYWNSGYKDYMHYSYFGT